MLIEKETCLDLILTCIITLVSFEPIWLMHYTYQSNSFLSALMITWFSRICFKPFWDYIDAYDNINMIKTLGY